MRATAGNTAVGSVSTCSRRDGERLISASVMSTLDHSTEWANERLLQRLDTQEMARVEFELSKATVVLNISTRQSSGRIFSMRDEDSRGIMALRNG